MKKWFKFFGTSFFSHKAAKEAARRGYTNAFLGFVLALILLWCGFVGGDMLPFGAQYNSSADFKATVHAVLADSDKRIDAEIADGILRAKKDGEYTESLLVNTLERDSDKQNYSLNGYHVVVDLRPASTPAEVEAYCVSNDGKNTIISYDDYLTLSDVARLNFDFKLKYTGNALELTDKLVSEYRLHLESLNDEIKSKVEKITKDFSDNIITKSDYNSEIYKLYFTNYYPDIAEYESASEIPLLRNYYYHQYISKGIKKYLFIFDDYLTASFETNGGTEVAFYGFYSDMKDGALVQADAPQDEANAAADRFIKDSFNETAVLNLYAHGMNVISLVPFIALMLLVATLLTYSLLKLRGVESIASLGAMIKIIGSFTWFSGAISAVLTLIIAFIAGRSMISAWPLVLFFAALMIRSIIFALKETNLYTQQSEQPQAGQTEG